MPSAFFLAILAALATAVAGAGWGATRGRRNASTWPALATVIGAALTVLLTIGSSWTQIGTQNVGIITSFGRPVGDLTNGLHFIPPWDQVTEMDNAVQADVYEDANCITVRIAEQQTACARVRIIWQMRQPAADQLFRQYQTPDNVRTRLVYSELQTAMNQQFDGYDPIGSLTSPIKLGQPGNPTVVEVAKRVTSQMQHEIGGQIHVIAVLVPIITYDKAVQTQLNAVLKQKAATDVALQAEKTAQAQARANADLAKSPLTQGVLIQDCLNLTGEAMKIAYTLPQGWNCLGSSSVGVIANGK